MSKLYTEKFSEMLENNIQEYAVFKKHKDTVSEAFQTAYKNMMNTETLTEVVNEELGEQELSQETVETVAEVYSDLGIIERNQERGVAHHAEDTFEQKTVYRAPNYHGRGRTSSWSDIKQEIEKSLSFAEREKQRAENQQQSLSLQDLF